MPPTSHKQYISFIIACLAVTVGLNIGSQVLPSLYVASDAPLSNLPLSPEASNRQFQYPNVYVGFWKQCTAGSNACYELALPCGAEMNYNGAIANGSILKTDQGDSFISEQAKLCPMMNAARAMSLLSLGSGVMTLVFLVSFMTSAISYLPSGVGIAGMLGTVACQIVAMILAYMIKSLLDKLAELSVPLTGTGTSTLSVFYNTTYTLSTSFWLGVASAGVAIVSMPLMLVYFHYASQQQSKSLAHRQSEFLYYDVDTKSESLARYGTVPSDFVPKTGRNSQRTTYTESSFSIPIPIGSQNNKNGKGIGIGGKPLSGNLVPPLVTAPEPTASTDTDKTRASVQVGESAFSLNRSSLQPLVQ